MNRIYRCQVLAMCLVVFMVAASVAESRTTAWWRFEDGQDNLTAVDVMDYGTDGNGVGKYGGGNVSGEPKYVLVDQPRTVDGKLDTMAIQMDGVDDAMIDIPYKSTSWDQKFTVEALIKWDGPVGGSNTIQTILAQGTSDGRNWLFIDDESQVICSSQPGGQTAKLTEVTIPVGKWIYIAQSYEYRYVYLWIDTNLEDGIDPVCYTSKTLVNIDPQGVGGRVYIGYDSNKKNTSSYFHGLISELRVTTSGNGGGLALQDHMEVELTVSSVDLWSLYE